MLLLVVPLTLDDSVFADKKVKHVSLEDLGVLQLAAHDLFNVNRCRDFSGDPIPGCIVQDFENGKLDLSTLLLSDVNGDVPFDDEDIALGGEIRNRENIMLFTVASEFGRMYLDLLDDNTPEEARTIVVNNYHNKLSKTYEKTFAESFPEPIEGDVTFTENLALRTLHDFLPDKIKVDNKWISTLDPTLHGKTLSDKELKKNSSKLDGQFDEGFLDISICLPPDFTTCIIVDLLEADSSFATQFETLFTFEFFLEELEDGHYDDDEEVMNQIRTLFAKGLNI